MNNTPVSIIIPIYNVEKYLNECVDSAIQQTYTDIEIILVDDGSTDNCPEICDEYAERDSRIKVIHKPNGGVSDARNAGLAIAKGEYIYFLDSDDYIEADAIETLIKEASHYFADVVFFDANIRNDILNPGYPEDYYIRKGLYSNPLKGTDMLGILLEYKEYRSVVSLLFIRHNILIENNLYFSKDIIYEDQLFTFKLFLRSKLVVHLAEPLYNRRVRENSIMTSRIKSHNFRSILVVASEMVNTYLTKDEYDYSRRIIRDCIYSILKSAERIYYRLSAKDKIALRRELKEFKNMLRTNNYLGSLDLQKTCESIRIMQIRKVIKHFLPPKFRILIKNVILSFRNQTIVNDSILTELEKTCAKPRLILIGTPVHGNLGDHAIAAAENELFEEFIQERQVIEIVMPKYRALATEIKKYINKKDIIVISGGGWLGTLWKHNEDIVREIISSYPDNKIVILPQTVYFEDTEEGCREKEISRKIYSAHTNLIFCLRDKASYEFVLDNKLVQCSQKCLYIPDMALALNPVIHSENREGILLCFRTDREKSMLFRDRRRIKEYLWAKGYNTTFTTNVSPDGISLEIRQKALDAKLKEYSGARLIITDRLHSMIFAAITGTPCIAFDNVTGKVKGVYEWIKNLDYIKTVSTVDEAITHIDILLRKGCGLYDNSILKEHFVHLVSCILK